MTIEKRTVMLSLNWISALKIPVLDTCEQTKEKENQWFHLYLILSDLLASLQIHPDAM